MYRELCTRTPYRVCIYLLCADSNSTNLLIMIPHMIDTVKTSRIPYTANVVLFVVVGLDEFRDRFR